MKYHLRVYGNFHYMDESEAYNLGQYETYEDAIVAAKAIVEGFFVHNWKSGVEAKHLLEQYYQFGEDPIILPNEPGENPSFSARTYTQENYKIICENIEAALTAKPNDIGTISKTSKSELKELLVSLGQLTIGEDFLQIENYPFEPSIAYKQSIFKTDQIDDIDFKSFPPTIRINDELIFLTSEQKQELENFATKHNIQTTERPMLWEWILEPFLDTEFTSETDLRLTKLLTSYGLSSETVKSLRTEVETQMIKYNFDTILWDWSGLGASDVLKAMRTKYNKAAFTEFYNRVMTIALLSKKLDE